MATMKSLSPDSAMTQSKNRMSRRTVLGSVAATACLVASYPVASSLAGPSPAPQLTYAQTIQSHGATPAANSGALKDLAALAPRQGIGVGLAAAKVVAAPDGNGAWTIASTSEGGICAATPALTFCGITGTDVNGGAAAATTYPADTLVSIDREAGRFVSKPSTEPGTRVGIAPPDTSSVVVHDKTGSIVGRAAVKDGLYSVSVPAQGTGATVSFESPSAVTLATRPAEG